MTLLRGSSAGSRRVQQPDWNDVRERPLVEDTDSQPDNKCCRMDSTLGQVAANDNLENFELTNDCGDVPSQEGNNKGKMEV